MLSNEEIIDIMTKPKSEIRIEQYKQIWIQATGQVFKPSSCCGTFNRLYELCVNYANKLKEIKAKQQ